MSNFISIATTQALKSPMPNKYGCIIVHNKKIVSMGYNTYKYQRLLLNSLNSLKRRQKKSCIL